MRTIDKIITKEECKYGAPLGRSNVIPQHFTIVGTDYNYLFVPGQLSKRIFDCLVPMPDGVYDKGGAYWGIGDSLRVSYTKDLTYIKFYRLNKNT
jgi:hypothetical protein